MDSEDAPQINLFLVSGKLVEHKSEFKSVFRGYFEVAGSLAEEIYNTPLPLEFVSVIDLKLEVEWTEFTFRTVLLEDSEYMCTTV